MLLEETSRKYRAYSVPTMGQFQLQSLALEFMAHLVVFSTLMGVMFPGIPRLVTYIDDILCFGITHNEHVKDLQRIFDILRNEKWKLNPKKCNFGADNVEYLDFNISKDSIRITRDKNLALQNKNYPTTSYQKFKYNLHPIIKIHLQEQWIH
ncbi:unnamed protein product [Lepeophtheirus salmonis]|uniref:(salmon louse) hypothetical protein n=1 Tax=Lepeophtheirus salmonis TaxID=72036 RepID=A0A7R8GZ16_LEPSM|nr:unnamed protein product [Lepeophtheirus salmonis]CAF2756426.1 unnamed protein product [Lepeophtheirus salmonis]